MARKRDKYVYVEWDDHCSSNNQWRDTRWYAERNRGMRCVSIGRVIAEDKDTLTLVGTWAADDGNADDAKCDQTIIKSCIRKRRALRMPD